MKPYEVIDNFLPVEDFNQLVALFSPEDYTAKRKKGNTGIEVSNDGSTSIVKVSQFAVPWHYIRGVAGQQSSENLTNFRLYHMSHMVYDDSVGILSQYHGFFTSCLRLLETRALLRIKCNLFPNTEKVYEHAMHTDFPFSHKTGLLYINTCDGYTTLEDGTKIDSVANRMLKFDAGTMHASSTTSNQPVRINVNISYF
jgi:hypothetical protein